MASAASLESRAMTLAAAGLPTMLPEVSETTPDPEVKIHVDFLDENYHEKYRMEMLRMHKRPGDYFFDLNDVMWSTFHCRHRHDPAVCRCRKPIYHVGQDEAIFKQNALPAFYWTIKGRSHLRPKSEGQGVMVSALFDEFRGFGMMLNDEEIETVNNWRAENNVEGTISPGESPGLKFFQYGKSKEGYWDGLKFQDQCIDFINVLEILYPDVQVLLEVDHSSGHLKEQTDGLMVNAMGLKWGGKTTPKRDSIMEVGCLGENVPLVGNKQLALGMIQKMIFEEGDPPPFQDPTALAFDRPMTPEEKAKEVTRRAKKKQQVQEGEFPIVEPDFVVPGYIGKNKGIFQVRCPLD